MISMFIDTSLSDVSIALLKNGKLLSLIHDNIPGEHSIYVSKYIEDILKENNILPKDVNEIIVLNGPGSFTGIRIGLTIAKVYAWTLNIPITTIYSLEAMSLSSDKQLIHVPIINARRGYVFGAIYGENQEELLKPQHITIEDLKKELEKYSAYEIITNDEFEEIPNTVSYSPNFLKIVQYFKNKKEINPHAVNPEYLKLTEAEEKKE